MSSRRGMGVSKPMCYLSRMDAWAWALLLKPFALLVLAVTVLIPVRLLLQRKMRDGKLKRLLLWRIPK